MSTTQADLLAKAKFFVEANVKSTADQAAMVPKIKALVLGGPKCGKTSLAKTCPKPLIIDADNGTIVLRKHDLACITTTSWFGMMETIQFLLHGEHDYETLFVDGINHLQADYVHHLQQKKLTKKGNADMDPTLWGALKKACNGFNAEIHKLVVDRGMHVIITCHSKLVTDDQGRPIGNGPDLQGDFKASITKAVDIMCYATVVEHKDAGEKEAQFEHLVLTRPYTIHTGAGDRWADEGNGIDTTTGKPGVALPDVGAWIGALKSSSSSPVEEPPTSAPTALPTSPPKPTTIDVEEPTTEADPTSGSPPSVTETSSQASKIPDSLKPTTEAGEPTDPEGPAPESSPQEEEGKAPGDEPAGPSAQDLQDQIRSVVEAAKAEDKKALVQQWGKDLREMLDQWAEDKGIAGKIKITDVEDVPFLMLMQKKMVEAENALPF